MVEIFVKQHTTKMTIFHFDNFYYVAMPLVTSQISMSREQNIIFFEMH